MNSSTKAWIGAVKQSVKLQTANGIVESSRLMLPEHREMIKQFGKSLTHEKRPVIDEQALEEINQTLLTAAQLDAQVRLTVFDINRYVNVVGFVAVDAMSRRIRVIHEGQKTWVPFGDIISAEIV